MIKEAICYVVVGIIEVFFLSGAVEHLRSLGRHFASCAEVLATIDENLQLRAHPRAGLQLA